MSISRKFTIWIISVVSVLGFISGYLYYHLEMKEEVERLESVGNAVGPLVEQSLYNYMLTKDDTVLDRTMHNLKGIEPISRIWLINREGVIKAGTDKKAVGTRLSPTDPRCQKCHEKGKRGTFLKGEKTFRWVQSIRNKPECYKCHSPQIKHNGVILIDFSLEVSEKHVKKDIFKGFLVFIPTIIFIGFVMFVLSKTVVINRLNSVVNRIKEFREGNYNARIPVKENDEITSLEDSFNEMAEKINVRDKERDELLKEIFITNKNMMQLYLDHEALVNSIDGIVWEADAQSFQFSFVSKQAERLLGYPIERWLTEPTFWKDHTHPDDREWAVAFCMKATSEKRPHDFEYRMIAADGRTIWLRNIVNVVVENDQPVKLQGLMVDITERKQAEDALKESEINFRNQFESSTDGIFILDMKGNFIDINRTAYERLGYAKDEMLSMNIRELDSPEHAVRVPERFSLIQKYGSAIFESAHYRKDGTIMPVEINSRILNYKGQKVYFSMIRDITERKKAEIIIKKERKRFLQRVNR